MGSLFTNHKTFVANLIDPVGFFGGKKGFLGLGEDKNKANDRKVAAEQAAQNVSVDSNIVNQDPEALKRIGRASLITSSQRGVLGNPDTSNKKLFGV